MCSMHPYQVDIVETPDNVCTDTHAMGHYIRYRIDNIAAYKDCIASETPPKKIKVNLKKNIPKTRAQTRSFLRKIEKLFPQELQDLYKSFPISIKLFSLNILSENN